MNRTAFLLALLASCGVCMADAHSLLDQIGNNAVVTVAPGDYVLDGGTAVANPSLLREFVFDGHQMVVTAVTGLTIRAEHPGSVRLLAAAQYADVLTFRNCADIRLDGLVLGHTQTNGDCIGDVIQVEDSRNITMVGSELYGSGAHGVTLLRVDGFHMSDSVIRDCSYGIAQVENSRNIAFRRCAFQDNKEFDLIRVAHSSLVAFDDCLFARNRADADPLGLFNTFFDVSDSDAIKLMRCRFEENVAAYFERMPHTVDASDCVMEADQWKHGFTRPPPPPPDHEP